MIDKLNPNEPAAVQDHTWESYEDLERDYESLRESYESLREEVENLYVDFFGGEPLSEIERDFNGIFDEHFNSWERENMRQLTDEKSRTIRALYPRGK